MVEKMLKQAKEVGIKNFDKLEIFKVQEKTFSEYCRYKCKTDTDSLEQLFPMEQSDSIARLYEVICYKTKTGFKIRSIVPIKSINLR